MAKGLSTGQTARYLLNPEKRKRDEEALVQEDVSAVAPPPVEAPPTEQDPPSEPYADLDQTAGESMEELARLEGEDDKAYEERMKKLKESKKPLQPKAWYNMVCYGLPNMIVTQVGKI